MLSVIVTAYVTACNCLGNAAAAGLPHPLPQKAWQMVGSGGLTMPRNQM
jgi:hypothetical protein